jgi:hypothetical protein
MTDDAASKNAGFFGLMVGRIMSQDLEVATD